MTKPTPHEAAIASLEAKIAETRTAVIDYDDQIATLGRERFVITAKLNAYQETLAILTGSETASQPAAPPSRAKKGEIPAAILKLLADYPQGIKLDGLVERTGKNQSSIAAALKALMKAGTIALDGERYVVPPQAPEAAALAQPERSAAE